MTWCAAAEQVAASRVVAVMDNALIGVVSLVEVLVDTAALVVVAAAGGSSASWQKIPQLSVSPTQDSHT